MTFRPSRAWRVLLFLALGAAALVVVFVAASLKMPYDAPRARMYRTEADIASLAKAVESFREARGIYPPPGQEGLRQATAQLSRSQAFFPEGPPPDSWARPYIYVPHTDYANADLQAQKCGDGWCAPDSFQLYSTGADGAPGTADDITSWDTSRPWREVYAGAERRPTTP